jgi:acetyl-CoA carboxylase biotin carboxyl carrier protein
MPTKAPGKDDPIDVELIRRLADLLGETGLSEIEVERGGMRIKVARTVSVSYVESARSAAPAPAAAPSAGAAAAAPAAQEPPRGDVVKSPMVGTCYLQANPGAEPFVRVGMQVSEGQTLMIVEAMKTMNPIPSPRAGKVLEILVDDGQPVEFGEPLVVLE